MKRAECNRTLLVWTILLFAVSFCVLIPFSLSPLAWGVAVAAGAAAFVGATKFDQKVPRSCAKTLWAGAAVLRWLLLAYVVYAVMFTDYDAESCASIFSGTLVPIVTLCVVMLPSQALVARRSKVEAARPAWTGVFHLLAALFLYGYGVLANKYVVMITDPISQTRGGIVVEIFLAVILFVISLAIPAVAILGFLQQKTAPDEPSEAVEETEK